MQIDPNTPMNQQISLLKSNMLAAQFMADSVDKEHLVCRFFFKKNLIFITLTLIITNNYRKSYEVL